MQSAWLPGVAGVCLPVHGVGHTTVVRLRAVVGQDEPGRVGERHRKITHVAEMIDLKERRVKVDGSPGYRSEEVRQGHVDAGLPGAVPVDLQDQSRIELAAAVIGEIEICYLSRPLQISEHLFLAGGDDERAVLEGRVARASGNLVQARPALSGRRSSCSVGAHRRDCASEPRTTLPKKATHDSDPEIRGLGLDFDQRPHLITHELAWDRTARLRRVQGRSDRFQRGGCTRPKRRSAGSPET